MAAELFTLSSRALDANGNTLAGAQLAFYVTGTSTPATVYSSSALTTPLTNPVTADSGGLFPAIYLDPGVTYRAILKSSAGVTLSDIDPIGSTLASSLAATAGAGLVGYSQSVTYAPGTFGRSLQTRSVNITDAPYNAPVDGTTAADTAFNAALATGRMVEAQGVYNLFGRTTRYNKAKWRKVQPGEAVDSTFGEFIEITNPTSVTGYGLRRGYYNHTGTISNGRNIIGDTVLLKTDSITNGFSWNTWEVAMSPLNPSSGLTGAPGSAQNFSMVIEEANPQNRYGNPGWSGELRRWANTVGGYQMIPETQDFTGLLGSGVRVGYNISFGFGVAKSPFTSSITGRHAKFYNPFFVNPCAIAQGGYAHFATGYRDEVTAIAISNAGSGYAVGDILTFNSGLTAAANEDTQVRVKAVNGSGGITSAEVYVSGWYQQSFASPVGVTGGTGTGATFTYTLSTNSEAPQAWGGIAGTWEYGLDAVPPAVANSNVGRAYFRSAMFRAPNNVQILHARNAADSANLSFVKLTASDNWEVSQSGVGIDFLGKLKLTSLTALNFANDTAAAAGGVQVGELYHNAGAVRVRLT